MNKLIALVGGIVGFFAFAFAAYTPTAVDQQLISTFSTQITSMYQANPAKIQAIEPKLKAIVALYSDETREYYVLNGLYQHIFSLTLNGLFADTGSTAGPVSTTGTTTSTTGTSVSTSSSTPTVAAPTPVVIAPTPAPTPSPMPAPTQAPAPIQVSSSTTVSSTQAYSQEIADLIASGYIKGNPNAGFTVVEFGDFQCPFCQRYTLAGTANALVEAYNGNVNVMYTHRTLYIHPLAQKAAEAAECVGAQGGSISYYAFKEEMFLGEPSRQRIDSSFDYINNGNLDKAAFTTCLDTGAMASRVKAANDLAIALKINGTPTHIFFKNSTGEYKIFQGGISLESRQEQIAQLEPSL